MSKTMFPKLPVRIQFGPASGTSKHLHEGRPNVRVGSGFVAAERVAETEDPTVGFEEMGRGFARIWAARVFRRAGFDGASGNRGRAGPWALREVAGVHRHVGPLYKAHGAPAAE